MNSITKMAHNIARETRMMSDYQLPYIAEKAKDGVKFLAESYLVFLLHIVDNKIMPRVRMATHYQLPYITAKINDAFKTPARWQ